MNVLVKKQRVFWKSITRSFIWSKEEKDVVLWVVTDYLKPKALLEVASKKETYDIAQQREQMVGVCPRGPGWMKSKNVKGK